MRFLGARLRRAHWALVPFEGAASENPINPVARAFLYELFPQREEVILEGGDHFSVTTDPAAVAEPIAEFVSRHTAAAALT